MSLILHITARSHWQQAQQIGVYRPDSLSSEGFIHCSTPAQVVRTANAFFAGQSGLLLLCIEPEFVQPEIRYETADGDQFPHIYGALNLDAVTQVVEFEPEPDGKFELPQEIALERRYRNRVSSVRCSSFVEYPHQKPGFSKYCTDALGNGRKIKDEG
ncbi:DUF952 domain-containing protein [Kovacikia minuta CCNUW1]|uniref:DUF952 domain-containing protein n=1 Tax=Kovacikia minuta TaxID=2931930 RepID=UPI001CCE8AA3|nr:DUF952 domain-containing protein [Kovacikia minuta]UBF28501.1 DUF952 domain-containing protein [Kovacikia minuta CCNUW1]